MHTAAPDRRESDPPFLLMKLLDARRAGNRTLALLIREWLAEVGIRVVFADELPPARRKAVSRG